MGVGRALRAVLDARRLKREIRKARRCALDDIAEGKLRVGGIARPLGPALEAPVSRRACVYYGIVIYAWDRQGGSAGSGASMSTSRSRCSDHGHRAVIDPSPATVSAAFTHALESDS